LKGVSEGVIDGTIVQQPYEFGYQSMIKMAKYIEGDKSVVPANKQDIIPTQVIDKSNVADFAKKVKDLLKK
jgi:ribose transport system substrate-binding protein